MLDGFVVFQGMTDSNHPLVSNQVVIEVDDGQSGVLVQTLAEGCCTLISDLVVIYEHQFQAGMITEHVEEVAR